MYQTEIYLGNQVGNMIVDRAEGWYMSADNYVRVAVENVEKNLAKYSQCFPTCCNTPIMSGYWPEISILTKIKSEGVTQYQEMVRTIRWSVDLGRVDILLETALMSTYLGLPCRGYLKHIFHIFGYLKVNPKRKLCFEPQHRIINDL